MAALLGVVTMKVVTAGGRGWLLPVSAPGVAGSLCRDRGRGPACLGDVATLILGDSLQVGRLPPR